MKFFKRWMLASLVFFLFAQIAAIVTFSGRAFILWDWPFPFESLWGGYLIYLRLTAIVSLLSGAVWEYGPDVR